MLDRIPLRRAAAVLSVGFTVLNGCGSPDSSEQTTTIEQKDIRAPLPQHVSDEVGTGLTTVDPSRDFDTRRDVYEDEDPAVGQDPDEWNQDGTAHKQFHGTRKVREYGFQWLRSYARNSTVTFFADGDFRSNDDGTVRSMRINESTEPFHKAEMALASQGFDICPDERFADQIQGGVQSVAECTGTLIDRNLILTAAHCVRHTGAALGRDDFTLKHGAIANVRVAFNHVISAPGEQVRLVPDRDVFRVREVLTINANPVDMSILQLLHEDGSVVEDLDPGYVPVPLWTSTVRPTSSRRHFRSGAAIGAGARLPLKISTSRSWGWLTDDMFAGINFMGDIYRGNSGGGLYDVETGSLIGVMSSDAPPTLNVHCPTPAGTKNQWPYCPISANDQNSAYPMFLVPRFNQGSDGNLEYSGCMQWTPQGYSGEEREAFADLVEERFSVDSATVSPPSGLASLAISMKAVRMMACAPTESSSSFEEAIEDAADEVLALRQASRDLSDCNLNSDQGFFCPTGAVIRQKPVLDQGPLFETFDQEEAVEILGDSVLCKGTTAGPRAELWSELQELKLENGRELTVHGTNLSGDDYFETRFDEDEEATDALYRIKVDNWTVLYADTFSGGVELQDKNPATTFDTVLFLMESDEDDALLLPSSWEKANDFDDSRCNADATDVNFVRQTQLVDVLDPSKTYILGVTGYAGQRGQFNLHVQSVPAPRLGVLLQPEDAVQSTTQQGIVFDTYSAKPFVTPEQAEENCTDQDGDFDATCLYNVQPIIKCQGTDAGEFGFVAVSCPESQDEPFRFRVDSTNFPFSDAVGAFWEGQRRITSDGYICSDDSEIRIPTPFFTFNIHTFSSEIGHDSQVHKNSAQAKLTSGAGVKVFYAHQFRAFLDWQNLGYSVKLPRSAVNDIWVP